jgi:hypothetical protein
MSIAYRLAPRAMFELLMLLKPTSAVASEVASNGRDPVSNIDSPPNRPAIAARSARGR